VPQFSFEGLEPQVHPSAFVAPTATLVGDVVVEEGASVWYGAVLRADYSPVIVRRGANVQDGAVLHGPPGLHTEVGPGATVAHNCVVHGAILEEECLVANGAVVLDGARIVPPKMLAAGSPVALKRPVTGSPAEFWVNANPGAYAELATRHRAGMRWLRD
jgi:carbonic anhydrase/acetyltransferase-like protein (isoleucine patch superfamily)